jgi:L-ascorbate metabolism protein UlaG (beta-lactamase superfamily)
MRFAQIRPAALAVAAVVSIGAASSPGATTQDGVSITFVANEGVLLSSGARKVLIDALFLKYKTEYAVPAGTTQVALARARPPFDSVDLVLATHQHVDHFHPAQVAAHLRANPRATLLTLQQAVDSLRGRLPAGAVNAARIMSRTTAPGTRRREVVAGINVELLGLPHGGHPRIEHVGYVLELGGRRILHVGDTEFTEAVFAPFRLDTARIDVALLPYGVVTSREGRRVIERWIRPQQVVAFHVGEREGERVTRAVQAALPGP